MSTVASTPEHVNQAIFTVCADAQVTSAAMEVCSALPSTIFAGGFPEYITADKRPQFSPLLKVATSCVALVDFDRDPSLALETAERLRQLFLRKISIIGIGSKIEGELMLRAMRSGCSEYLITPIDAAELAGSLLRFRNDTVTDPKTTKNRGKIVACFGAKGGVGTTTLTVHLATHLASRHGQKTLLIDHKHELGHVALYLGLKDTRYNFGELIRNVDRLDREFLRGFVIRHTSGIDVIASPDSCAPLHASTHEDVRRVMDFLRGEYEYVLLDSSVAYSDLKISVIEEADAIYIVSTPDVAALRDLARHLEHLSLSDPARDKINVIINRSTNDDDLSAQQIEAAFGYPVGVTVPNNFAELLRAINTGEPISLQRRSEFNRQIGCGCSQIVTGVADYERTSPKKKTGFAFWRQRGKMHA
jgi:pilus assembly protein CpaE